MGDKNDMRVGLKDTIKITQSDLNKNKRVQIVQVK